ncbi:MAG: hypothetical protein EOS54_04530 [Mesorhizobium sp.]|uniref:hypothetical protein n=1 Tax=unclassified Mesorhizobium TaxID=325217 RepID=UPI000F7504ED|nr:MULTISPECIES: hypothetical protein [unclassified Mesorhizobium]AZO47114.1 hypothetical protein EJ073_04205 [Mesorhizobium sp. M4B.F.Ca.ET.058.02.1.1]RWC57767.1 MAG: hypothetical protein EOS54_04530 [Mesorhizobium sp.]RWD13848.1 MAG: hypothetical protein EOS74_17785 [Mesorhizobium sp.]RWD55562.1 MAG: hypothetical protein EOS75_16510 [Mesorhizobium sp.]TIU64875.1 MAG: hypothetical protein E5W30_01620 [Mesorhizobium sp.]
MRKEIERHLCRGDSGREYEVVFYQNYRRFQPLSGPAQDVPTMKEAFLSDGRAVNVIDDNTFRIVISDELIRKIR